MKVLYPYKILIEDGLYKLVYQEDNELISSSETINEAWSEYYKTLARDTYGSAVRDNSLADLISMGQDIHNE